MTHPIVSAARAYIGVPFRHRGRSATRLDCAGLAIRALRDAGRVVAFDIRHYGQEPWRDGLRQAVQANMGPPVDDAPQPGDVLLMRFNTDQPHHIAIAGDYLYGGLSIIHAYAEVGRVVEHRLDDRWRSRIVEVYR